MKTPFQFICDALFGLCIALSAFYFSEKTILFLIGMYVFSHSIMCVCVNAVYINTLDKKAGIVLEAINTLAEKAMELRKTAESNLDK